MNNPARRLACLIAFSGLILALSLSPVAAEEQQASKLLRVGIIGTDTSHSTSFTKILNNPEAPAELKGCRVVAAALSSSDDIAESARFGETIVPQLKKMGVEIVPTIEQLLEGVDVVLLETNDGRVRLEQALPVLKAGKPVFVDKPIAASLADVIAIYEAGKRYKTPVFSSSSLRYTDGAKKIGGGSVGDVLGCETFSPCPLEKTHPDLFWYGIHGVETLFTIMGPGCERVVRSATPNTDVVVGTWKDGRIGSFRGRRKDNNTYLGGYGGTAFGSKGIAEIGSFSGYEPLLVEVVKFFKTGVSPVSAEETIEIYAFMEAAQQSKRTGGRPVAIEEVLRKGREQAAQRLAELTQSK